MLLRWKTAVVLPGGAGVGREVCLRLARSGCGVLVADPVLADGERTAALVRERRVSGWALEVDPDDELCRRMLVARARDLGGADLLVTAGLGPDRTADLAGLLLPDADARRVVPVGRRAGDGQTAVAVLALLTTAEPGTVVAVD